MVGVGGQRVTPGLLVSFEGIDGVGKSTQIAHIQQWLVQAGQSVVVVREPGGTAWGEALREVLLHGSDARSPWAEFFLFASARAELVTRVIKPSLASGKMVLADRYIDSSVAYQAFGRGIDRHTVMMVNEVAIQGCSPNLTVWLKGLPFNNDADRDQFERREIDYFERVEEGYRWLSAHDPERWLIVDCRQSVEDVSREVQERLQQLIRFQRGR